MSGKLCAVNLKNGIKRKCMCGFKNILHVLCFFCVFTAVSCGAGLADFKKSAGAGTSTANDKSGGKTVSIISWNLQNFFDGVETAANTFSFAVQKARGLKKNTCSALSVCAIL